MKLLNFRIRRDNNIGEIEVNEFTWDIRNAAIYVGMSQNIESKQVELVWRIDPTYSDRKYSAEAFRLVFHNVNYLELLPRNPKISDYEDECLDYVTRLYASEVTNDLTGWGVPVLLSNDDDLPIHLFFHFRGGQRIRIGSEQVEFEMLPQLQ